MTTIHLRCHRCLHLAIDHNFDLISKPFCFLCDTTCDLNDVDTKQLSLLTRETNSIEEKIKDKKFSVTFWHPGCGALTFIAKVGEDPRRSIEVSAYSCSVCGKVLTTMDDIDVRMEPL